MVKTPAPQKNIHKVKKTKSHKGVSPSKSPTQKSRQKNENAKPPKKSKKKNFLFRKFLLRFRLHTKQHTHRMSQRSNYPSKHKPRIHNYSKPLPIKPYNIKRYSSHVTTSTV